MFWQGFLAGISAGAIIFGVWAALLLKQQLALEAALGSLLHEALMTIADLLRVLSDEGSERSDNEK